MLHSALFRFVLSLIPSAVLVWFDAAEIFSDLPGARFALSQAVFIASLLSGCGVFSRALSVFRAKRLNEEFFVAIPVIFGWCYSVYYFFSEEFESAQRLMFAPCACAISAALLSEYFRDKTRPAGSAYSLIGSIGTVPASIFRNGGQTVLPADEVRVGDIVSVRPGEIIPCDGEVLAGRSDIDEKTVTGDIIPIHRAEGDEVLAGSRNISGFLTIRASGENALSRLALSYSSGANCETVSFSGKITAAAGALVLLLPTVMLAVFAICGNGSDGAFYAALAALMLCPCGFYLCESLTELAAARLCLTEGVEIKKPYALNRLCRADEAVIDRTGTATVGKLSVGLTVPLADIDEKGIIRLAAAVCSEYAEQDFSAVVEKCRMSDIAVPPCILPEMLPGKVIGIVDGQRVALSSLHEDILPYEEEYPEEFSKYSAARLLIFADRAVGLIFLEDKLKPNAIAAIDGFSKSGIRTVLVTGGGGKGLDAQAEALGASEYFCGLSASDKADYVSARKNSGKTVMMIGDGVSDSPALLRADFSFALASGAEAAKESACAVLRRNDLRDIIGARNISGSAVRAEKYTAFALIGLRAAVAVASAILTTAVGESVGLSVLSAGIILSWLPALVCSLGVKK